MSCFKLCESSWLCFEAAVGLLCSGFVLASAATLNTNTCSYFQLPGLGVGHALILSLLAAVFEAMFVSAQFCLSSL